MNVSSLAPRLNRWNNDYIAPGVVGSVGDTNMSIRFKQSTPDYPMRWDPLTAGEREVRYGTYVTDGSIPNLLGAVGYRLIDHNWDIRRPRTFSHITKFQTVPTEDCSPSAMPIVGNTPQYAWKNQVATVMKGISQCGGMVPAIEPYQLPAGQLPRGGAVPRITTIDVYGDVVSEVPPAK
jgi:hypothetical protein